MSKIIGVEYSLKGLISEILSAQLQLCQYILDSHKHGTKILLQGD